MLRRCPSKCIRILEEWYSKSETSVNWNGCLSLPVSLVSGVQQGSCLAGYFFAIYVNETLIKLNATNCGCSTNHFAFSSIMYADDLVLLAPSVLGMQQLIDVCMSEFIDLDMQINDKKSTCIKVGPRYQNHSAALTVNRLPLTWSPSLKYLGHV